MPTNISHNLASAHRLLYQEGGFLIAGTTESDHIIVDHGCNHDTGTQLMSCVVPVDGAELLSVNFVVHSAGVISTSGTEQWSIGDGTNELATLAAFAGESVAGTILSFTMASATNGKAVATTGGTRLILTNTEAGTVSDGPHGRFSLLWAV